MKKLLTSFFMGILFSTFGFTVYANEELSVNRADEILINAGFSEELLSNTPPERKNEMAKVVSERPGDVSYSENLTIIDNIKTLEFYVNTSDNELSKNMSQEEIKLIRHAC